MQHVAQAIAVKAVLPTALCQNPVRLISCRSFCFLSDKLAEDIRDAFVESPGLSIVFKWLFFLSDTMGDFVSDHIDQYKRRKRAVRTRNTVNHLSSIPECVGEILSEVLRGDELHTFAIDGV